ncbi:phytanoyl-CoA dioxygenase family protein [Candidatus Poriferisocius sp.]|uniref:phytanoyl-CoA dioxygenase family protein n=1 Tax=Candidatus Poriferisocius sp. TaxID=3101276 RepID=UPI003B0111AC
MIFRLSISASRRQLFEDGYTVLPEILTPEMTAAVRAALEPHFGVEGWGRNDFEGSRTERIYSLLDKCPVVASLVEHEAVLALLDDHLRPSRLLAACQATRVHPGETLQEMHCDDDLPGIPRPRPPGSVSVMWTLSHYRPENGSTLLVPGSHSWTEARKPGADEIVSLDIPPGSALVWLGGVYHGAGPNVSDELRDGINVIYFQPWLRQVENMTLVISPERAASFSETVQRLLGYSVVDGTFFGHVNGRDPIKLIPPNHREGES